MHLAHSQALPGNFKDRRNYIWGAVSSGAGPGDVVQFEGCYFEWKEGNRTRKVTMDHHTAIVGSVNGSVWELIHQNGPTATAASGGPVVVEKLNVQGKQRGTIKVWRPVGNY